MNLEAISSRMISALSEEDRRSYRRSSNELLAYLDKEVHIEEAIRKLNDMKAPIHVDIERPWLTDRYLEMFSSVSIFVRDDNSTKLDGFLRRSKIDPKVDLSLELSSLHKGNVYISAPEEYKFSSILVEYSDLYSVSIDERNISSHVRVIVNCCEDISENCFLSTLASKIQSIVFISCESIGVKESLSKVVRGDSIEIYGLDQALRLSKEDIEVLTRFRTVRLSEVDLILSESIYPSRFLDSIYIHDVSNFEQFLDIVSVANLYMTDDSLIEGFEYAFDAGSVKLIEVEEMLIGL